MIHTVSMTGSAKNAKRMKMFKKPNYVEQFTKVNARLNDLHDAYRILLQNVNKLQKEVSKEYTYDNLEVELYKHGNKLSEVNETVGDNYRETDERLNKLEENVMKLSDKVHGTKRDETILLNPFEEYLTAKEQFVASKMNLLLASVWSMEWNVRTINCLRNNKIETLKDLCSYSEKSLLKTKNLGQKTLNEIKSVLAQYDLKLREKDELDKNTPSAS